MLVFIINNTSNMLVNVLIISFIFLRLVDSFNKEYFKPNPYRDIKIKSLFEKYKQLQYLESPSNSEVNKLKLIKNSSFLEFESQLVPNYFKDLEVDF